MKHLLLLIVFLTGWSASAQFSIIERNTSNRFFLLGHEWSPSFFSLASTETDKMNNEGGRISTYNYVTFGTYFGEDMRFAVRVPFQYNTAGTDRFDGEKQNPEQLLLQDLILSWQNYNLALLPWDISVYWEGRVYLPTSQNSRDSGLITRLRNDLIFSKMLSRTFGLEYQQKFNYYVQSRTVYPVHFEDEDGYPVDTTAATKRIFLDHWVTAWANVTPQVGVGWDFGGEDTYWNSSSAMNKSKPALHMVKMGPSIRFPVGSIANCILSYEDKVDVENNRAQFGRFLSQNTDFTLLSFIHF